MSADSMPAKFENYIGNATNETSSKENQSPECPAEPIMMTWFILGGLICAYVGIGIFCAAKRKFGNGCSRFALVHLIVYSGLLIAGTVWSINVLVSRDCAVEIMNITLPFLVVQWVLYLIGLFCTKFKLDYGDVYLTKIGMVITAVILTILLLTPSIAFLVLRNSECAAFIPLWDMTSSFSPILLVVFVQAIKAKQSSLRIIATFAYLLYVVWFAVEIVSNLYLKRRRKTHGGVNEESGQARQPRRDRASKYYEHQFRPPTETPSYWTSYPQRNTDELLMEYKENAGCKLVEIDKSMYRIIETAVKDTWQSYKVGLGRDARGIHTDSEIHVLHIERIENLKLFHNYALERKKIFGKRAAGLSMSSLETISGAKGPILTASILNPYFTDDLHPELNECFLFHGTKGDVLESVLKQGLDMRLSSESSMFGRGVYLAESSTKSDQYTDGKGQRDENLQKMLLVRVCLGSMCVLSDARKLRRPPCEKRSCGRDDCDHENRHDSVVADGRWLFREFILYDLNRCYPEFVITYVRT